MVLDVHETYPGGHSAIYTDIKSLCCTPETNMMLYVDCNSIKNRKNKIKKNTSRDYTP